MKTKDLPIAASLCIGLHGDGNGVNLKECAVRLAKTGSLLVIKYQYKTIQRQLYRSRLNHTRIFLRVAILKCVKKNSQKAPQMESYS